MATKTHQHRVLFTDGKVVGKTNPLDVQTQDGTHTHLLMDLLKSSRRIEKLLEHIAGYPMLDEEQEL